MLLQRCGDKDMLRFVLSKEFSYFFSVTVMTLTGQASAAACASTILSSSKVPTDMPFVVPLVTWDFPSESLSKWVGSRP